MTLWPDTVVLDGVTIPLAGILASLSIHHGRQDINDEPTATTCQVTLLDVDHALVAAFEVGQTLAVTVRDGAGDPSPRFTGKVTDASLDVDDLTIIAAGELARLRNYEIGEVNWPAETWSARVERAFAEAGLAARLDLVPDPAFNPELAARDTATAGPTTLGDYLAFLVPMVGALVADKPDGDILVQAVGARRLETAVALDPADVAYAPIWSQVLPGGNIVTVTYEADQGSHVTVSDPNSISIYGERPEQVDTAFRYAADATKRANQRLGRSSYAHWNIAEAPILRGLDTVRLGAPVVLDDLPASAPSSPWTPVVEGWSDELDGDSWRMILALSDPLISGVTVPWDAVPPTSLYRWNTIDPATDWTEALTLEDLDAG